MKVHVPAVIRTLDKVRLERDGAIAQRDALRNELRWLRSAAERAYEQAPAEDHLLHTYKDLKAAINNSGRALAELDEGSET